MAAHKTLEIKTIGGTIWKLDKFGMTAKNGKNVTRHVSRSEVKRVLTDKPDYFTGDELFFHPKQNSFYPTRFRFTYQNGIAKFGCQHFNAKMTKALAKWAGTTL